MTSQTFNSPVSPAAGTKPLDLWPEVTNARDVLDDLMRLWRAQQPTLTIDDARRLSVLVFNGVRTVAILLTHQLRLNPHLAHMADMEWLDKALEQLGEDMGIDL
ncbi:hypothetical protein [Promineifilum sp.]|uniref:hypothetical protein n=1 Tax=Promineifilum sp. TaxID=2664178 RepID=UPI0035B2116A